MLRHFQSKIFKILKISDFGINITTMVMGTAFAQILTFAVSPLIARLYSPEQQGIFAIYIAAITFVGPIASGTYEQAIVLPEKDQDAQDLFSLSLIILTFVSLAILVLSIVNYILNIIKDLNQTPWFLIPINIFLLGLFQISQSWQTRNKNFSRYLWQK